MNPFAVDVRLVRALLGTDLRISPGRALMARVVAANSSGRGALSIAGTVIDAELPDHVQAGQELRLIVAQVTPEKVVLSLSDHPPPAQAPAGVPLPGGGTLRVTEQGPGESGIRAAPGTHVLALRYDAPALGPVDLRFELSPTSLRLAVALTAGDRLARAQARTGELQDALRESVGRSVIVSVSPRREPIDVYA